MNIRSIDGLQAPRCVGALLAISLSLTGGLSSSALAAAPFELDGNAVATSDVAGTDWDVVNAAGNSGLTAAETDLIVDYPEPARAIFTGGGSKDEKDVPDWKWRNGKPPGKDDLTNAYAAAVRDDNENFVVVFGMDRFDTSGDAQLGFWFFQEDVKPIGAGNSGVWNGGHQVGDVLVLVNFSNGGSVPNIEVYMWDGNTAVPVSVSGAAAQRCENGWLPLGADHCGITNAASIAAPWSYVNKDVGPTNQFPAGAFFEGAIDLTALGIEACFTGFLAESRSSTSINAVLKDFAGGGFPVCSVSVTKSCTNPRLNTAQDRIIYDITGKVTNDGFGTIYNVGLTDVPKADGTFQVVDCLTNKATGSSFPLSTLSSEACYTNTITVALDKNGTSDTVTATANTASDDSGTTLSDSAKATCPNLSISPAIRVSKDCKTTVVAQNSRVVAKVTVNGMVCNTGDTNLTAVSVADLGIVTSPNPLLSGKSLSSAPTGEDPSVLNGACATYTGTYFPAIPTDDEGDPTNCPGNVVFKDTVKATATNIFGAAVTPHTDMADCKLCDGESCPTPE